MTIFSSDRLSDEQDTNKTKQFAVAIEESYHFQAERLQKTSHGVLSERKKEKNQKNLSVATSFRKDLNS